MFTYTVELGIYVSGLGVLLTGIGGFQRVPELKA